MLKINEVKGEILSITNLATKNALNVVENKIPCVSNLVNADYITIMNEMENKIIDHNHDKYITAPEFNKLTAKKLCRRSKTNKFSKSGKLWR